MLYAGDCRRGACALTCPCCTHVRLLGHGLSRRAALGMGPGVAGTALAGCTDSDFPPPPAGPLPPEPAFNGTQRWVSPSGGGDGLSSGSPSTLSAAHSAANNGDVLNLTPGSYGAFALTKSLRVRGTIQPFTS